MFNGCGKEVETTTAQRTDIVECNTPQKSDQWLS